MKKNSLVVAGLIMLMVLGLTLTGCTGGTQQAKVSELVVAIPEEIESTDVQQVRWNNIVHDLLHEPFVNFDLEMKNIVPAFAKSYEVAPDGKQITFKFAEGAKFSNGDPITAEEIKKSMERYIAISPYGSDYEPIKEIIVKDAQTIVLKFDAPRRSSGRCSRPRTAARWMLKKRMRWAKKRSAGQ